MPAVLMMQRWTLVWMLAGQLGRDGKKLVLAEARQCHLSVVQSLAYCLVLVELYSLSYSVPLTVLTGEAVEARSLCAVEAAQSLPALPGLSLTAMTK